MTNDHHHHDHDIHGEMPFDEKLLKLLSHWIKHNEEHASNYRSWAEKAKTNGKEKAGILLDEAADMCMEVNRRIQKAIVCVQNR